MSVRFLIGGPALLALLGFACLSGRATAQNAPTAADPPPISVAGQVVDSSGKPIAGARVVLREWSILRYSENPYLKDIKDTLAETKSDAEGKFRFEAIKVQSFKYGGGFWPWDVVVFADGFGLAGLHLTAGREQPPVTLTVTAAKTIAGRIVDAAGAPVAGCRVTIAEIADADSDAQQTELGDPKRLTFWRSQLAPTVRTDDNGRFEIAGLPAGKRLATAVDHPRFKNATIFIATTEKPLPAVMRVEAGPRGERKTTETPVYMTGFQHSLVPGGRAVGRVVFADTKQPAANTKVSMNSQNRATYDMTDSEGRFSLDDIAEAEANITATTDVPDYLSARTQVKRVAGKPDDVTIELPRGVAARGMVVDADTGAGVAKVLVSYLPETPAAEGADNWSPSRPATTDEAGRFEIAVPPGKGAIRVGGGAESHPTYDVPDYRRWKEKKGIAVGHLVMIESTAGQAVENVKLVVGRGLVLRGRALDAAGEPMAGAAIAVRFEQSPFPDRLKRVTDKDGRFEIAGLPNSGACRIDLVHSERGLSGAIERTIEPWKGPSEIVELEPIQLQEMGTVKGRVIADGQPKAGIQIMAYANIQLGKQSMGIPQESAATGEDGQFSIRVPANTSVNVQANADDYALDSARTVRLRSGETQELPQFELRSRNSFVSGMVVDPDGNPVAGVLVTARQVDGPGISYSRRGPPKPTGPDGRFRLEDLPSVPLELMAYIPNPPTAVDRSIRFPAQVNVNPGQTDVRILFDPKLQRTLPSQPRKTANK